MSPKQKKRLVLVLVLVAGVGAATALALAAFKENMLYFYDPSQIAAGEAPTDHTIRVGGMVTQGSVKRAPDSLEVAFDVTDFKHHLTVKYTGILPDLFREGQGIVAIGKMQPDGSFQASEVLAKHDEKYMPPEVAGSLKPAENKNK